MYIRGFCVFAIEQEVYPRMHTNEHESEKQERTQHYAGRPISFLIRVHSCAFLDQFLPIVAASAVIQFCLAMLADW
jgi:hypothetical protein